MTTFHMYLVKLALFEYVSIVNHKIYKNKIIIYKSSLLKTYPPKSFSPKINIITSKILIIYLRTSNETSFFGSSAARIGAQTHAQRTSRKVILAILETYVVWWGPLDADWDSKCKIIWSRAYSTLWNPERVDVCFYRVPCSGGKPPSGGPNIAASNSDTERVNFGFATSCVSRPPNPITFLCSYTHYCFCYFAQD